METVALMWRLGFYAARRFWPSRNRSARQSAFSSRENQRHAEQLFGVRQGGFAFAAEHARDLLDEAIALVMRNGKISARFAPIISSMYSRMNGQNPIRTAARA